MKTVIGIDTGSQGCIAIWKKERLDSVIKMPKDLTDLKQYFDHIKNNNEDVMVFLEKVQMFSSDSDIENKGKQFRIQKLLSNYDQIKTLITFYGFPYVEVYPVLWQSSLGIKTKGIEKKLRKTMYKECAAIVFPGIKITLWNADALCILKFGLNKIITDPKWIYERIKNTNSKGMF